MKKSEDKPSERNEVLRRCWLTTWIGTEETKETNPKQMATLENCIVWSDMEEEDLRFRERKKEKKGKKGGFEEAWEEVVRKRSRSKLKKGWGETVSWKFDVSFCRYVWIEGSRIPYFGTCPPLRPFSLQYSSAPEWIFYSSQSKEVCMFM